jgi:hypothetical protein
MDPKAVAKALELGEAQAAHDAADLLSFWDS